MTIHLPTALCLLAVPVAQLALITGCFVYVLAAAALVWLARLLTMLEAAISGG